MFRFDGASVRPVGAKFVEGLERLRFSAVAASSGTVWAALSDMDSRKQSALAATMDGVGWELFSLKGLGLEPADGISLHPVDGGVWALSRSWGDRYVHAGPEGIRAVSLGENR